MSVRVRPLNRQEQNEGFTWRIDGNSMLQVDPATREPDRARDTKYALDHVFGPGSTTADLYLTTTHPLIQKLVSGFNSTVFAYGQTSSGKTYTMRGTPSDPGIISLAVREVFSIIERTTDREFLLRVSYMEVRRPPARGWPRARAAQPGARAAAEERASAAGLLQRTWCTMPTCRWSRPACAAATLGLPRHRPKTPKHNNTGPAPGPAPAVQRGGQRLAGPREHAAAHPREQGGRRVRGGPQGGHRDVTGAGEARGRCQKRDLMWSCWAALQPEQAQQASLKVGCLA